jgi:K+-sensing histidine kinase KdpD
LDGTEETLLERFEGTAVLVGPDLKIVAANGAARALHPALPGTPCFAAFGVSPGNCCECPVRRVFEEGCPCSGEETFTLANGEAVEVSLVAVPLRAAQGSTPLALLLARHEGSPGRMSAKTRLASQSAFVGSITHALKGGLGSLEGGLYLLESGQKRIDADRIHAGLDMVRRNLARVRSLVGNVLYFARDREVREEELTVDSVVEPARAACRKRAEAAGVDLVVRADAHALLGDPHALQAMLACLLEGALDACSSESAEGGRRVLLEARSEPPQVVFEIGHDGTAMDPGTLRGALGETYVPHGADRAGLWIHAAARIARAHGGTLDVAGSEPDGRRIVVRLPCAPERD